MDVTPKAFNAIHKIDTLELQNLSNEEIRPILPCLAGIAFRYKYEASPISEDKRNKILEIIKKHEDINSIISVLSYDFQAMELDLKKESEQRTVARTNLNDLKSTINENTIISLDFSRNENFCRHRLIINELLELQQITTFTKTVELKEKFCKSELFELDVCINEISDVICCAMFELPDILKLLDVVECLLYVRMGERLICRIAANFSEHFEQICLSLLRNSKQTENEESLIGKIRTNVLRSLCKMNPSCVSLVLAAAIEMGKMTSLYLHFSRDYVEIFDKSKENKSARYLNELATFVRNIQLIIESDARSWSKDGQKQVDLLEEKILNHSDQNKNEVLYEPVYTLACQVYNRINDLLDLSDDRIETNKELLLMFARIFTLFNSTLSDKFKLQHEMEDYKDRFRQQKFLNTREKENGIRMREKLEECEAQIHEDIQRYEAKKNLLESKIKNLEKDRRKLEYEIEDNLKELKHTQDSITNLLKLIEEYGSNEYGIGQFFQVFQTFVNNLDLNQSADKTKIINQLNNVLEKKLIDVKNEILRLQEEKILTKIKSSEDRINKILENGANSFNNNDFVFEPMFHKIEGPNALATVNDYYYEEQSFEYEDDLTESLKQLKKLNQENIDRMKFVDQINCNNELAKDLDSSEEHFANLILDNLIDEYIQEEIKNINEKLREENNKAKLTDILSTGLVKINSNNEIVANKLNSNLSQAKLMLINENNTANMNEEHITSFQEDTYNRFEISLDEIITHSVNQTELSSPGEEGETLQSILDSKQNSLSDSLNDEQRKLINNYQDSTYHNLNKNSQLNNLEKTSMVNGFNLVDSQFDEIIEILEKILELDDFNEIIDKEKLMKKSVCSPKRQNKLAIQLTPENKVCHQINGTLTNQLEKKDAFTNTDLIELKTDSTLTDNLNKQTISTSTEFIETKDIDINTDKKLVRNVSSKTDELKTNSIACSTKDLKQEASTECNLVNYKDKSTGSNLNKSVEIECKLTEFNDFSSNTGDNLIRISTTSTQTKPAFKILRSTKIIRIRKNFRNFKVKNNSKTEYATLQNGDCNYQISFTNNNYLNGYFNHQQNDENYLNNSKEATINGLKNQKLDPIIDYDYVFCNHMPPLVNFLIGLIFLAFSFLFKMIKNFILVFVFLLFLLQLLFFVCPPPRYLSWQDIIISILEPHITVHHYHKKV